LSEPILIAFRAEHLTMFVNRNAADEEQAWMAIQKEKRGPAFTAVADDHMFACAGVFIIWRGVGVGWAVLSPEMPKYRIWLTRTIKRVLEDAIRIYKLHRLETMVDASNKDYRRWVELLGFQPENGVARVYTADRKDTARYERILCKP